MFYSIRNLIQTTNKRTVGVIFSGVCFAVVVGSIVGFWDVKAGLILGGGLIAALILLFILNLPVWGLYGVLFLLPYEKLGTWEIAGSTIRLSWLWGTLWLLAWSMQALLKLRFRKPIIHWPQIWLAAFLYLVVSLLSLTNAVNWTRGITVWLVSLFTCLIGFLVYQAINSKKILTCTLNILFITTGIVMVFGLYQWLGDLVGLPRQWTGLSIEYTKAVFGFPRLQSTAAEPLYYANFALIPLALAGALYIYRRQPVRTIFWSIYLIILGGTILLTLSRGGIMGAAAVVAVLFILGWRRLFQTRILALILSIIVLGAGAYSGLNYWKPDTNRAVGVFIRQALNYVEGPAVTERLATWSAAWEAFQEHPLLGIGPGNFGPSVSRQVWEAPGKGWLIVNNEPLELLAETGLLGFGAIAAYILMILFYALRAFMQARDVYYKAVLAGGIAALCGVLVHWQTFSILFVLHIWVLVGLLAAVSYLVLKPDSPPAVYWRQVWYSIIKKTKN